MTANTISRRTESQLLRQLAAEVRRHPERHLSDSVHEVMHGEDCDRWVNFIAALRLELHTQPLNTYDHDELHVGDGERDHPAVSTIPLDVWAARIGSSALVAATLDLLAATAEREYEYPSKTRAKVGGRAYRGRVPRAVLELADEYFGGSR